MTVNLVLTLRKAVSLAISVWFYGNGFSTGLAAGGGMVLRESTHTLSGPRRQVLMMIVGTIVYSMAPGPREVTSKAGHTSSQLTETSEGRSSSLQTRATAEARQRRAQAH